MKKIYTVFGLAFGAAALISSLQFSGVPPSGLTGASGGGYCTNCHSSSALNAAGGSVSVSGLPASNYVPGQVYPFSLTITHAAANRLRWGFSITAVNGSGTTQGSFSSTNPNAAPNFNASPTNSELSHNGAVSTAASSTYTYNNLRWTAPAAAGQAVTFYYVGNAANGSGSGGDFIYAGTSSIVLPAVLQSFLAKADNQSVRLQWATAQEQNTSHFVVQRSEDGQLFYPLGNVTAAGNSSDVRNYQFADNRIPYFGRTLFYRLQQVDKDGRSTQSDVAKAVVEGKGKSQLVNLYPNIAQPTSQLTAQLQLEKAGRVQLRLVDAQGRQLLQQNQWMQAGAHQLRFALPSGIGKGMYTVVVGDGSQWQQQVKVMVQ